MKVSAILGKLARCVCFVYLRRSLCRRGNCHLSLHRAVFKLWTGPHNLVEKKKSGTSRGTRVSSSEISLSMNSSRHGFKKI